MKIIKIFSLFCLILLASCSSVTNNQSKDQVKELNVQIEDIKEENTQLETKIENQNQEQQSEKGQIEMVGVHGFSSEILDKIDSELKGDKWVTSYFYLEGKTYVLLASPTENKKKGIDFDGFSVGQDQVTINYQTFDYHEELPSLNKRLLYELNGNYKIEFLQTYSTEQ